MVHFSQTGDFSQKSLSHFCLVRGLGYPSLSLCVTIIHITPVISHLIQLFCNGAWISVVVFSNDPKYDPSYVVLYGNNIARLVVVGPLCLTSLNLNLTSSKGY